MQLLNQMPRGHLSEEQVRNLLTGDGITLSVGAELLNGWNWVLEDVSDVLVSGEIQHDNYAKIHGSCKIELSDDFTWGRDRFMLYMNLTDVQGITARFNLGVYVMTSPVLPRGEDPITYSVDGYDLLYLLESTGPGDTYVLAKGSSYLTGITSVLAETGTPASMMLLDGTRQSSLLPEAMVWALPPNGGVTWLQIMNDLLAAINYQPLWVDENGTYRSGPYLPPAQHKVEWTFDLADIKTNIVGVNATKSAEAWGIPNWWRFVRKNMSTRPITGDGLYTVTNQSDGATSIDVIGRTIRKVVHLEAADQTSLVAQGDRIVAEDRQVNRTYDIEVDPFPIAGHFDVVRIIDNGISDKCLVSSWTLPFDGSPGKWTMEVAQ